MTSPLELHITKPIRRQASDSSRLSTGDWVEVRSREEILATLDKRGQIDGLPFMPEMFAYCGQRFRVQARAHKTCDTVNDYKGRRMHEAVHLEGLRCDGQAHGGCQAGCLLFWKEAWLSPTSVGSAAAPSATPLDPAGTRNRCTDADVIAGTQRPSNDGVTTYVCQATQVPAATEPLAWWDWRQYLEDYTSGNVSLGKLTRGFIYVCYNTLVNLGIGIGGPLRWLYDVVQTSWGAPPYPRNCGSIPAGAPTPTGKLDLQEGELVRIKSYKYILSTCDVTNKNRGMAFDGEMVPYIPGPYRVLKRVTKIINEKTGKMQDMKNPCIILDTVTCQARYSTCRMFCPRSIHLWWREIWLERAGEPGASHLSERASWQASTTERT